MGKNGLQMILKNGKLSFVTKDIYDTDVETLGGKFDIIILKDVIEHIHDQEKLLARLKDFLNQRWDYIFWISALANAFWRSPAIEPKLHYQKFLIFIYFPRPVYKGILKLFKEKESYYK